MTERIREACDLLIEAGFVVPVVPHGVVLEDHTVAVRGGEIVAVLGPNGAGKTTAFELLLGLVRPTAGTVTVNANIDLGALGFSICLCGFKVKFSSLSVLLRNLLIFDRFAKRFAKLKVNDTELADINTVFG